MRGYGMTQPAFAVESAIDELAVTLGIDPLEVRRRNIVRPGDALLALDDASRRRGVHRGRPRPSASTSSTTALRRHDERARRSATTGSSAPASPARMHETAPPTDHISEAWATLRDDGIYEIAVGTVEFGEGTSTAHVQIAATQLGTTPSRIHLVQSDTDRTGFDTGAFASAGLFVAGNAVLNASTALRDRILAFAASPHRRRRRRLRDGRRRRRVRRHPAHAGRARRRRRAPAASGSPRRARPTGRRAA